MKTADRIPRCGCGLFGDLLQILIQLPRDGKKFYYGCINKSES